MTLESMKRNAQKTIAAYVEHRQAIHDLEERLGKDWTDFSDEEMHLIPAGPSLESFWAARRTLCVVEIAEGMTADEVRRITAVPLFLDNMSTCKDIKDKYKLSWSELRELRLALQ